jgi:hypothetical protein
MRQVKEPARQLGIPAIEQGFRVEVDRANKPVGFPFGARRAITIVGHFPPRPRIDRITRAQWRQPPALWLLGDVLVPVGGVF